MAPVADLLAMDRTSLTAALKPLERRGLVRIEPSPADRRNRLLVITEAGSETLAEAVPIWRDTHTAIDARLDGIDLEALRAALILLAST